MGKVCLIAVQLEGKPQGALYSTSCSQGLLLGPRYWILHTKNGSALAGSGASRTYHFTNTNPVFMLVLGGVV